MRALSASSFSAHSIIFTSIGSFASEAGKNSPPPPAHRRRRQAESGRAQKQRQRAGARALGARRRACVLVLRPEDRLVELARGLLPLRVALRPDQTPRRSEPPSRLARLPSEQTRSAAAARLRRGGAHQQRPERARRGLLEREQGEGLLQFLQELRLRAAEEAETASGSEAAAAEQAGGRSMAPEVQRTFSSPLGARYSWANSSASSTWPLRMSSMSRCCWRWKVSCCLSSRICFEGEELTLAPRKGLLVVRAVECRQEGGHGGIAASSLVHNESDMGLPRRRAPLG